MCVLNRTEEILEKRKLTKKTIKTMKTKIFALMAAMMLLMGTTAMAQNDNTKTTETELKGDVNGDGIVDVADIAAVIAVMHEQGTVKQQYYWYVGQENPAEMTSISPIVTDNSSPGWRLIGTSVPKYTQQSPLWDGQINEIVFDNYNDVTAYLALPNETIRLRDGLFNDVTGELKSLGTTEINGVIYYIYKNQLGVNNCMQYSLDLVLY